ncbi:hypothetical protein, partial [Avibacterium avium]
FYHKNWQLGGFCREIFRIFISHFVIGSEFILFSDLLVFSLELITGFAVGDFLSFACPKERKQRKGNPDQTAFPHSNKIFLTKSKPILATLRSGVTFLKILSPFGRFGRGMRSG